MFENVTVVGEGVTPVAPEDVEAAEAALGTRFPIGYAEYVTRFGEGILGGVYVRVYPPERILHGDNNVHQWRERIARYWFWHEGSGLLTQRQAAECVVIGDTYDGDELVVHPSLPDRILVLPRYHENVLLAGSGLADAIEWLCGSGVLTEPFAERNFEPFDG